MFTLRDHVFPKQTDNVAVASYAQSVGETCDALNRADQARARNARRLSKRLSHARTTLTQRNALLDSTKQILSRSERDLAGFRGLDVPAALQARERETARAWARIVARLRGYAQRLDAVTNRNDLLTTVRTLPAMRTALAGDGLTLIPGLIKLGGGRCKLNVPIVTPTITLPKTTTWATPPSFYAGALTSLEHGVTPSVDPPAAHPPPLRTPTHAVASVDPCSDGRDNDGDGKTDYGEDRGCSSPPDGSEAGEPPCSDRRDNDGDGRADFGEDRGCSSPADDSETTACCSGRPTSGLLLRRSRVPILSP
jgi:hypothetical protein